MRSADVVGTFEGRIANRIANGTFSLGGKTYTTPLNDHGIDTLHGGWVGYVSVQQSFRLFLVPFYFVLSILSLSCQIHASYFQNATWKEEDVHSCSPPFFSIKKLQGSTVACGPC